MKNSAQVLSELKQGNKIVTRTSQEEMDVINLLVDNGYAHDTIKEYVSNGVYTFAIRSVLNSIELVIEECNVKGIEVMECESISPFMNYFPNKCYYIFKSGSESLIEKFNFKNSILNMGGNRIDVLDIIPQI